MFIFSKINMNLCVEGIVIIKKNTPLIKEIFDKNFRRLS